jgi:hypothetical protein
MERKERGMITVRKDKRREEDKETQLRNE